MSITIGSSIKVNRTPFGTNGGSSSLVGSIFVICSYSNHLINQTGNVFHNFYLLFTYRTKKYHKKT